MPSLTHWSHPDFFAYFPANASLAAVLGDMISSGLGVVGLSWQACPPLTELEDLMADWLRQMVGLSAEWQGAIQDSGSTSNMVGMLCAREHATKHRQEQAGLQAESAPLVIYTSTQSHSSVRKAALLAGFGSDYIRAIETDDNHAVRADLMAEAIAADHAQGLKPCAIVATTGTTATTALDPIDALADLAEAHDLWFHVDSAMAGCAMIVPEHRWMWAGIERVDSIVFNPHKWLGAVFDCSLFYVRDPEHLIRVMSTNPSYLRNSADSTSPHAKNYRDWGIPLGRRFRALKLWCLVREQGVQGLQARVQRDMNNAQWLRKQIDNAPHWERLAPVPLQTVCVRHRPDGLEADQLDTHTLRWVNQINQSGAAYLTPAKINGHWMVRVSIGSEPTTLEHVKALWATLQAAVS